MQHNLVLKLAKLCRDTAQGSEKKRSMESSFLIQVAHMRDYSHLVQGKQST